MKRAAIFVSIIILGLSINTAYAEKGSKGDKNTFNRPACNRLANSTRNSCIRTCQSAFADDEKICKARDAGQKQCLEACFNAKDICIDSATETLTTCLKTAGNTLLADIDLCTQTDLALKFACENAARVKAFASQLACHSAFKLDATAQAALRKCKSVAKDCNISCKAVSTPIPTVTPAA